MTKIERAKAIILEYAQSVHTFSHRQLFRDCHDKFFQAHVGRETVHGAMGELIATDKKIFSLMEKNDKDENLYGYWES